MLSVWRWVDTIGLLLCSSWIVQSNISADFSAHHDHPRSLLLEGIAQDEDMSDCILLFGAYCNGNMGDVIQASTLSRLVSSVSPEVSCVWHAHPSKEALANGFHEGEFFANNSSAGIIKLGCDRESGEQVSRFKGFVIGGGGLFESRHWPLDCEEFVEGIGEDTPVAIFGVGASVQANLSAPIIRRANYVSGRDQKSVNALSELLSILKNARTKPDEVARVRDPVLSDGYFKDISGRCWRQSQGDPADLPLCFALPSALTEELQVLHRMYASEIVRKGDLLLNVFPKHQAEIEEYPYPTQVEAVLDPAQFASRLCGCRAVITSRLHGTIIGLHSGVPTIAAWPTGGGNKVPDLMKDVLRFPDQFLLVGEGLTREALSNRVDLIRAIYATGRRDRLFEKLDFIARHTQEQSFHVLKDVFGVEMPGRVSSVDPGTTGLFWKEPGHTPLLEGKVADEVRAAERGERRDQKKEVVDPVKERPSSVDQAEAKEPWGTRGEGSIEGRTVAEEGGEGGAGGGSVTGSSGKQRRSYSSLRSTSPWERWRKAWGMGKAEAEDISPEIGGEVSFASSLLLSLGALLMIALLGLPALASLPASEAPLGQGVGVEIGKSSELLEGGLPSASASTAAAAGAVEASPCSSLSGDRRLRAADVAFFGMNYTLWVALSVGFNVCSKTYMRQTRNPMALLAIQGWVGIAVLCSMNVFARYRHRGITPSFPRSSPRALPYSPRPSPSSPLSSTPSSMPAWAGKCGPRQLKRVGRSVWQAGVLHSSNTVLTSWSVLVGGVSATHALKALEPVAAAGFSRWLLGSTLPPGRVAAVAVIVLGLSILMAPFHIPRWAGGGGGEVSAEGLHVDGPVTSGLDLAIPAVVTACACCTVALRNVLLKRPDPPPPPPPLGLLVCSVVGAAVGSMALLVPFLPSSWEWSGESVIRASGFNAALCFVGYNLASFNLLSELSPVGHAVGNASKRVFLFASGLFLLGEEESMSPRQLTGASVAFLGLASYNIAGSSARSASLSSR